MGKKLLGSATIKVDGAVYKTNPGAKIDLGGPVREAVKGSSTVHGYTESIKESALECEISVDKDTSIAEIQNIVDATIAFEADTGQTWIINSGWLADTPTVNEGDGGKVALKFCGPPAEEMK